MVGPRYLTKSRFKMACECETKLYYTKKAEYADRSIDDPFLLELAKVGYQVGEFAKYYFSDNAAAISVKYVHELQNLIDIINPNIPKGIYGKIPYKWNNF